MEVCNNASKFCQFFCQTLSKAFSKICQTLSSTTPNASVTEPQVSDQSQILFLCVMSIGIAGLKMHALRRHNSPSLILPKPLIWRAGIDMRDFLILV